MHIKRTHIKIATDEGLDPWAVSDGLLYHLCEKYPDHRDAKGVTAKMLLIGRAYAATAERGRSGGSAGASSNDDFYIRDLPQSLRASGLDAILLSLVSLPRITEENIAEVIVAHTTLMDVLRELTGINKRSLASKYLHFHLPNLFFILDSRAHETMRLVSPKVRQGANKPAIDGDHQYIAFVRSALSLRETLEAKFGHPLTPRHVDRILLALAAARGA